MATQTNVTVDTLTRVELENRILRVFSNNMANITPGEIRLILSSYGVTCKAEELGCRLDSMHREGLVGMSMRQGSTPNEIEVRFGLP